MVHRPLLSKYSLESPYELLCFGQSECQRWQQAYDIGAAYACEYVLFEQQPAAYLLDGFLELHTVCFEADTETVWLLFVHELNHAGAVTFVERCFCRI